MSSKLLAAATAVVALMGISASTAQAQAYPPTPRTVTATPSFGEPAYEVTVAATCTPGESITFSLLDAHAVVDCVRADTKGFVSVDENLAGVARAVLRAPTTPGNYRGVVRGTSGAAFGSFAVSVLHPDFVNSANLRLDAVGVETSRSQWQPTLAALGAMGAVVLFMGYTVQNPLQLAVRR